ncbi:unnamed protein product [Microthlaspi erraticum]|uniref:Ubiquitin receptor RAD23 n=1 Tax=Microthlaspi erraticum TaxID=1685480 RepID=A0A6D2JCH7_9BRAS|nr:unnamed protein product [Microthlaspi erraticum]
MLGRNSKSTVDVDLSPLGGGGMNISLGKNGCLVEGVLLISLRTPTRALGPRHHVSGHTSAGAVVRYQNYHWGQEGKKSGRCREYEYDDDNDDDTTTMKTMSGAVERKQGEMGMKNMVMVLTSFLIFVFGLGQVDASLSTPQPSASLQTPNSVTTPATPPPTPASTPAPAPVAAPVPMSAPVPEPEPVPVPASIPASIPASTPTPDSAAAGSQADVYGQAASNLAAGSNLESTIQQILDMGGGTWDRDTVIRALRAAFNNPERAVEYLYSGIPEQPEVPPVARAPASGGPPANPPTQAQQPAPAPASGPNANPLDLFPQGLPNVGANPGAGTLDFLRNSQQFQALRTMVQANPQVLQPMLQELGKQNPNLMRLIQDHQADFLRLINEPIEAGGESGNLFGEAGMPQPQAIQVTIEEREAIERLEAMGFERALVLEVFFACNKNEELAANYLLDHMHEFEE